MFENIGKKISETGKAVGDRTKQVAEAAKLSYKVNEELRAVGELYAELGKAYFDAEGANADGPFFDKCREIAEKLKSAECLKAELNALKGVCICQECGAEIPIENDFCGKCGAKLVKPEPPKPAEDEEEACEADFGEDTGADEADAEEAVFEEEKSAEDDVEF